MNKSRIRVEFRKNENIQGNQICLIKYENYEEIFVLPPDVGVAISICVRSLI